MRFLLNLALPRGICATASGSPLGAGQNLAQWCTQGNAAGKYTQSCRSAPLLDHEDGESRSCRGCTSRHERRVRGDDIGSGACRARQADCVAQELQSPSRARHCRAGRAVRSGDAGSGLGALATVYRLRCAGCKFRRERDDALTAWFPFERRSPDQSARPSGPVQSHACATQVCIPSGHGYAPPPYH